MANILTKFEHNRTNQYKDMVLDNIFLRFDLLTQIKQVCRGANANANLFFKVENRQYLNESRVMSLAIHVRIISGNVCTKFHSNILNGYRVMAMVKVFAHTF